MEEEVAAERDRLAEYRTLLAEKRTVLAEVQLALLLVTLPLTVHTGLTVLATRHQIIERLHVLVPFWLLLGVLLGVGLWTGVRSLKRLRVLNKTLPNIWARLPREPYTPTLQSPRSPAPAAPNSSRP